MRIWFWIKNAPIEAVNWWVDASGPWGSSYRNGFFPVRYHSYIDIGPSGTLSISANPSGRWSHPGIIPGGSAPYSNLQENAEYNLDFNTGVLTLLEEAPPEEAPPEEVPPEEFPVWAKGAAMLFPWSPLFGPPLPKGLFPPWPMWMSRWTEIPGYPKVPS